MAVGLKFYTDSLRNTTADVGLSDAKVIVYEDNNDNKYILDASNVPGLVKIDDIKLSTLKDVVFKYHPKGATTEANITSLGSIIGALFATQSTQNGQTILAEEVAKKPVVDVLVPELAKDNGSTGIYTKKGVDDELAKKANTADVYTKKNVDDELAKKADVDGSNATDAGVTAMLGTLTGDNVVVKINASNLTDAANQRAFAEAILPAKDGNKSILINKLGEALDKVDTTTDKVYGAVGQEKIAKEFLADKYPFVKTVDLATEVAKKPVVDVLVPALATVGTDDTKKVYTKGTVDTSFVKTDGSNISTQTDKGKALVDVLVPALATVGTGDDKKVYTKTEAGSTFLKTADLGTKVAEKAVVDVLVPALATVGSDNTKKVYTKTEAGSTFLKTADLGTKVAEKAVVDVLVPALATVGSDDTKKVYTKGTVDTSFVKTDGSNISTQTDKGKALVDVLVPALATVGTGDDKKVYTKTEAGSTFLKTADLGTKVAEKAVVDVLVPALATGANDKGIYTKKGVDDAFVKTADLADKAAQKDVVNAIFNAKDGNNTISETKIGATFAKKDGSNIDKVFAGKVFDAKDGNKSILVDKLEGFLAENAKVYSNNTKTAKELLVPSAAEIAAKVVNDPNFTVNVTDTKIKEVVKETVSQPYCDIPEDESAPISAVW